MIIPETAKDKLAIVVVGYNKLNGLMRLLNCIDAAFYESDDIPLIVSIDASGNEDVYELAREFQWHHGKKYVNIETERLGLKNHIFQCASMTKYFKGVIILEDDLFLSPYFYHYSQAALDEYGEIQKIAGISLYQEEINGYVGLPFQAMINQYDVYAWQTVCSWGEVWNERMWNEFQNWLEKWDGDFEPIDMIGKIKRWPRAWSKFYYAFIISTDKYFIYPYQALSTNFNDAGGEHGGGDTSIVQVSLIQGKKDYRFGDFKDLVKYDVYSQNLSIPQWLEIPADDITIDFYGLKDLYKGHYILAPFELPYRLIKGFSLNMRPWEMNIKAGIDGDDIRLYYKENDEASLPPERVFTDGMASYYLRGFNQKLLDGYMWKSIKKRIRSRLHFNG